MSERRKGDERPRGLIATRREALRLLGVRDGALLSLERAAKVRGAAARGGYTDKELKRLLAKLKEILAR